MLDLGAVFYSLDSDVSGLVKGGKDAQNSLAGVDTSMDTLDRKSNLLTGSLDKLGVAVGGAFVAGFAALGGGITAVGVASFNLSKDIQASQGAIQSELGVTSEEADKLNEATKQVFGNSWGENFADASSAVIETRKQIRGLADDELQKVTEGALALRDSFGVDVAQSTQAVSVLMEKFGVTSDEALNMLASGFQSGLNNSGDFLDTITEYGGIFSQGGASADQFFNILASGQQTGVLGTDKIADSFKELNAIILDGSPARKQALDQIGLNGNKFLGDLSKGKKTTMQAFDEITGALSKTKDEGVRNQAAVSLLGTMVEDMGFESVAAIESMSDSWTGNKGAVEALNKRYKSFDSMAAGLWRKLLLEVEPFTTKLLEMANDNMPKLEGAVGGVSDGLQGFVNLLKDSYNFYNQNKSAIDTLLVIVGSLTAAYYLQLTAMGIYTAVTTWWTAATAGATGAQALFNVVMAASPIGWVALAIGGLIAVIILLWANWSTVSAWLQTTWNTVVQGVASGITWLWGQIQYYWGVIMGFLGASWGWIQANFFTLLKNGFLALLGPIGWLVIAWQSNLFDIQGKTQSFVGAIGGFFGSVKDRAIGLKDSIVGAFQNIGSSIGGGIKDMINSVAGNFNRGIESVNSMIDRMPEVPGVGRVPRLPTIPKFSKGVENFEGGLAYVHKGEVLVNLAKGTDVLTKSQVDSAKAKSQEPINEKKQNTTQQTNVYNYYTQPSSKSKLKMA